MNKAKVAIITGVTKGIGRRTAIYFAKNGINIAGIARNKEGVEKLLGELTQGYKIDCLAIGADVSREEEVNAAVLKTVKKFNRIDILINNAGIGVFDYIVDSRLEDWQRIIDVNLKGVYLCSRAVLPQMIKQKGGKIINISSICGLRGSSKCGIYCASKFGVIGFSEALSQEVKPYNIGIFVICPGIVDTDFADNINRTLTDSSNMLKPEDVAGLVLDIVKSGIKSKICEINLKPRNIIERFLKIKKRKPVIETIKYL